MKREDHVDTQQGGNDAQVARAGGSGTDGGWLGSGQRSAEPDPGVRSEARHDSRESDPGVPRPGGALGELGVVEDSEENIHLALDVVAKARLEREWA